MHISHHGGVLERAHTSFLNDVVPCTQHPRLAFRRGYLCCRFCLSFSNKTHFQSSRFVRFVLRAKAAWLDPQSFCNPLCRSYSVRCCSYSAARRSYSVRSDGCSKQILPRAFCSNTQILPLASLCVRHGFGCQRRILFASQSRTMCLTRFVLRRARHGLSKGFDSCRPHLEASHLSFFCFFFVGKLRGVLKITAFSQL